MNQRDFIKYIIDFFLIILSYSMLVVYIPDTPGFISRYENIEIFAYFLSSWLAVSYIFKKHTLEKCHRISDVFRKIIIPNLLMLGIAMSANFIFKTYDHPYIIIIGTIVLTTIGEITLSRIYFLVIHAGSGEDVITRITYKPKEIRRSHEAIHYSSESLLSREFVKNTIESNWGEGIYKFITQSVDLHDESTLLISATSRINIEFQPDNHYDHIINLIRINDLQYINKFLESVNRKLPFDGTFTGCAETAGIRKNAILHKYPPVINKLVFFTDYLVHRVMPKCWIIKRVYYFFSRGKGRVISLAELLGRLYSCGFEIIDEYYSDKLYFFIVQKTGIPDYNPSPTYGPFIKLNRIGKEGKIIRIFKLRTMHPFSEYLQEYIHQKNNLAHGGKFRDDFRISRAGAILRRYWLDELPMIINVLKGQLKLVGVRPLSEHYYNLYSEELKQKRIQYKPGLIPPFYADLPKSLEEIQESELRYLRAYEKHPLKTNWKYFRKAAYNILSGKARSC